MARSVPGYLPNDRPPFGQLVALGLQLAIGITTVVRGFPLAWATAHNAGAAFLLLSVIAVMRFLWPSHAQPREQ